MSSSLGNLPERAAQTAYNTGTEFNLREPSQGLTSVDLLCRLEEAIRELELQAVPSPQSETITISRESLIKLAYTFLHYTRTVEAALDVLDFAGLSASELDLLLNEYETTIGAYEEDTDMRIALAASILHLLDAKPTDESRRQVRLLANNVLRSCQVGDDPVISDGNIDSDYLTKGILPLVSGYTSNTEQD